MPVQLRQGLVHKGTPCTRRISYHGLTLLELLICLALTSILLLIALPSFNGLMHKSEADSTISTLFRAWQHARSLAVTQSRRVTLCGSDDGLTCQKEWQRFLILFADANGDRTPDNEEILHRYGLKAGQGTLQTRVGFGTVYASIEATGKAPLTGSFLYCHPHDPILERKITWNMAGRLYLTSKDANKLKGASTVGCEH